MKSYPIYMTDPDGKMLDRRGIGEFVSVLVRQLKYRRDDFKVMGPMGGFTSLIDLKRHRFKHSQRNWSRS